MWKLHTDQIDPLKSVLRFFIVFDIVYMNTGTERIYIENGKKYSSLKSNNDIS